MNGLLAGYYLYFIIGLIVTGRRVLRDMKRLDTPQDWTPAEWFLIALVVALVALTIWPVATIKNTQRNNFK